MDRPSTVSRNIRSYLAFKIQPSYLEVFPAELFSKFRNCNSSKEEMISRFADARYYSFLNKIIP